MARAKKSKRAAKASRMAKVLGRAESLRQREVEREDISYNKKKADWLLAHNSIRPTVDQQHGVKGFRRFWVPPDQGNWKLCDCGWRPDLGPHYSALAEKEK
jgi:hypothetical protein